MVLYYIGEDVTTLINKFIDYTILSGFFQILECMLYETSIIRFLNI